MTSSQNQFSRTGWLLIVQSLLIAIPFAAMTGATGWPATTGDPGREMLPLVSQFLPNIRVGYSGYLLYSVLFFFTAVSTLKSLGAGNDSVGIGAAALSALARCLGILRWLTAAPFLAAAYVAADETAKAQIAAVFDALNIYGGGVGELLGVSLFSGIWLVRVGQAILRDSIFSKTWGYVTFAIAAVVAFPIVEIFGLDLGPILSLTGAIFHFWLLAMGIAFIKKGKAS